MVNIGIETDIGGITTRAMSGVASVVLWGLLILGIAVILVFVWYILSFKHKVRVKKIVKGRVLIIDDKARVVKKDGVTWWKLAKLKQKVSPPPDEAIDITRKGKLVTEAYMTKDNRLVWINNVMDVEGFKEELDAMDGDYRMFTGEERALYAQELREAEAYKKNSIAQMLTAAAPYIAIIMIFVLFLLFFGRVMEPANEMGASLVRAAEAQRETHSLLRDIIQNRETVLLENNTGIPPN